MATPMQVSIVSPEEAIWEGEAELVIARSPEGEFGIMYNHIPFLAALVPGAVTVVAGSTREVFLVTGGFLEANGDGDTYHVIVLADDAEPAGQIDADEVKRKIEEMRKRVAADDDSDRAEQRGEAEMRAALASVEVAESRGQ
ncbi:MAG: F-type H+-transporting ATPase subunit epsilon [Actinomycetota bacterium]|nr:F-type H+-transporting ATPase subunit epsilon [Actinomycetota bacterium]